MSMTRRVLLAAAAAAVLATGAAAQAPGLAERVEALKASLAASRAALQKYQWIETTTITVNGEVKSVKTAQASYGPDGQVQKFDTSPPSAPPPGGIRGRIMERKKEEMTAAMQSAVALVKSYVPPEPAKIAAAKAAGNISLAMPAGGGVQLNIANYEKPGDRLSVTIDPSTNQVLGLAVNTWGDAPSDTVTLTVTMATLPGGISYPATSNLYIASKGLGVTVNNGAYTRLPGQ